MMEPFLFVLEYFHEYLPFFNDPSIREFPH